MILREGDPPIYGKFDFLSINYDFPSNLLGYSFDCVYSDLWVDDLLRFYKSLLCLVDILGCDKL